MARIDPERAQLVLRVVYDGPARSGKTTSVRALARSLCAKVYSGADEQGRTLFFDWVDYVGGLFEGMPIRCQIVSVPGQTVLERRRRHLLETADAVLFVADSSPLRVDDNQRSFALLRAIASQEGGIATGIVVQANKRDLPDAISLDDLRDALGGDIALAMTETAATGGEGVRETFVLAIRLALDRVRALAGLGLLDTGNPDHQTCDQLLASMMDLDGQPGDTLLAGRATVTPIGCDSHGPVRVGAVPCFPDDTIPPGHVWPPVRGRAIVHEAARHAITIRRAATGGWDGVSESGGWQILSPGEATFAGIESGRDALIAWARWHAAAAAYLSPERAIVLARNDPGDWRLWQIVHACRTLLDECRDAVRSPGPAAGEALLEVLDLRRQAMETLVVQGVVDRVSLGQIAVSATGAPLLAGPAAYPPRPRAAAVDARTRMARADTEGDDEVLEVVRAELAKEPERLPDLLAGVESAAARRGRADVAGRLRRSLINR